MSRDCGTANRDTPLAIREKPIELGAGWAFCLTTSRLRVNVARQIWPLSPQLGETSRRPDGVITVPKQPGNQERASSLLLMNQWGKGEADVSTEQSTPQTNSWLPSPYGNPRGPCGFEGPTTQGAQATCSGHSQTRLLNQAGSSLSFPKTERLRKRPQFLSVARRGKRHHDKLFVLIWAPGPHPWTRLGITASKRVGNAVARNRAKRLIREAFRRNKWTFPGGTDVVIIAKPKLVNATFTELEAALLRWAKDSKGGKGRSWGDSLPG